MIKKMPELAQAPGYDKTDNDNPYVAFASFKPYVFEDEDKSRKFISLTNEIYNSSSDDKILNFVALEIFETLATSPNPNIGLELFTDKALKDFQTELSRWNNPLSRV
jgi:hypothetical protein